VAELPDDDELFRDEVADVAPLRSPSRASLDRPRPKPIPFKRIEDEMSVPKELLADTSGWDLDIETGDLITFLRPGLPGDILRKLRRGQWVVQASMDLHGATTAMARAELAQFLAHARHNGIRCVRIIHGKGTRSPNNIALIRNKVRVSLSRREEVLAFCDAAPADGGSGAVLVLLRAS
jgi:DNA-nicking Smr family endonuclease